jgi:hypothetical protein
MHAMQNTTIPVCNRLSEFGDRDDFADFADFVTATQEITSQIIDASKSIIAVWCILTENEFLPPWRRVH